MNKGENERKDRISPVRTYGAGGFKTYLDDFKLELQKVSWPKREKVIKSTGVILGLVVISTILISTFDLAYAQLYKILGVL